MASTIAERKGGAERTGQQGREQEGEKAGGSAATGVYEVDSADDELATLMPTLKRQFEAFDDNEGTLNFMGEVNMANNEESFRHNYDKENVASDHETFSLRRRSRDRSSRGGSARVTTSRPIDYSKLFAMNQILVSPPSGSLYKNTTLALKERPVNISGLQSKNVDDFWLTEREKKISAVARRKLVGIKTTAQAIPPVVEDRHARHARSRRGRGNSRVLGKRPIKFDLHLDAAKISELDHEALAEEEVSHSTRSHSRTFISTGRRPALRINLSDLDQGRNEVGVQPCALADSRHESQIQGEQEGNEPSHPCEAAPKADSPSSLPDMDWSAGESPLAELEDFSAREKDAQTRLQNPGSACPESPSPVPGGGRSQCLREDVGNEEIIKEEPRPRDSNNIEKDPSLTPCKGFPVLESNDFQTQNLPVTSPPTPPSNPVAVYMSLTHLEGEVRQRRLSFISSSPSIATSLTSESEGDREERMTDFEEVQSPKDLLPDKGQVMTTTKDVQDEECLLLESESRRDICDGERDQMSTSNGDVEARDPPCCEDSLSVASCDRTKETNDEVSTQKAAAAERERVESSGKHLSCSEQCDDAKSCQVSADSERVESPGKHLSSSEQCDDAKSCEDQIFSSGASFSFPSPGENALLAISQDYPDDDDLEVPADVKEAERILHKSTGTSLAQQPQPTTSEHENKESVDDDDVEHNGVQILIEALNGTRDHKEALPCVETQQNCAAAEGVIGTDEGSTTETKPKTVKKRARKAKQNRRFSLQDSGTIWKDGQRRSQRIHVRPLEWWRGEKLLYGRIHESLTTVIGIKHSSPGKYACGIQEPFVVESYVPAKYSELVRFAAI